MYTNCRWCFYEKMYMVRHYFKCFYCASQLFCFFKKQKSKFFFNFVDKNFLSVFRAPYDVVCQIVHSRFAVDPSIFTFHKLSDMFLYINITNFQKVL